MLGDLASGRNPLSTILAGGLAILLGAPLVLGLVIRGLLMAAALAARLIVRFDTEAQFGQRLV